ncbi:MAG: hypothetical protein U0175_20225 [Caldilineaceae bacterium]
MKRFIIQEIGKLFAKSALLAAMIGVVVAVLGYLNQWNSLIPYSNAFFVAGCLLIIAGASSRFTAGQETATYRTIHPQSMRDMSFGDQISYIVDSSSPISRVMLGVVSGLLLIVVSAIAAYLA